MGKTDMYSGCSCRLTGWECGCRGCLLDLPDLLCNCKIGVVAEGFVVLVAVDCTGYKLLVLSLLIDLEVCNLLLLG